MAFMFIFVKTGIGGNGFRWTDVDPNCEEWTFADYAAGLKDSKAERQFAADLAALD